jgi:hypothetical protein
MRGWTWKYIKSECYSKVEVDPEETTANKWIKVITGHQKRSKRLEINPGRTLQNTQGQTLFVHEDWSCICSNSSFGNMLQNTHRTKTTCM